MSRLFIVMILALPAALSSRAQIPSAGFSRIPASEAEYRLNQRNTEEHPSIQPAASGLETAFISAIDTLRLADSYTRGFRFQPLLSVAGGVAFQPSSSAIGQGYAGFVGRWHREDTWSASLGYAINGGYVPDYVARYADSLGVLQGAGYAVNDGNNLRHSHMPFGHIGYKAGKFFHFELGRGKHFWGDGYRSLVLSDVPSPFPYLRITTKVWKIKYTNLWMRLEHLPRNGQFEDIRGKYAALHALSWNVSRAVNVTFYEMVIWQDRDSLSRRHLDMNYLNPLIFYRPVEFAQGSADNVIMGLSTRIKVHKQVQVYGQFVIDEFLLKQMINGTGWWANKYAGQIGIKAFDVGTPGLHLQTEFNGARPFTYTHGSPVQAWGHLNQPLAHPMGTNFYEWLFFARYLWKGWEFRTQFTWGAYGRDGGGANMGGDIFRSYKGPAKQYENTTLQGERHTIHFHHLTVSRELQRLKGWEVFAAHLIRFEAAPDGRTTDHWIQAGIRLRGLLDPVRDY